jgi:biotin operon repressor
MPDVAVLEAKALDRCRSYGHRIRHRRPGNQAVACSMCLNKVIKGEEDQAQLPVSVEETLATLSRQARAVYSAMEDGGPYSVPDLARKTGESAASVSARIRDLRRLDGLTITRTVESGTPVYRLRRGGADGPPAA